MRLAVIPARGGSKRIPLKNIKQFAGKPMIAWSIEAALESACFDRVIVSTDDDEIAEIAKIFGAEVPFKRPTELSNDFIGTSPVIAHVVEWQRLQGEEVNEVCCLYATAPFVRPEDIMDGLNALINSSADYSFAVTSYRFPIQRAIRISTENGVEMFQPEHFNTRSQDLEEAWHDAGQFYWGRSQAWVDQKPLFGKSTIPIILPRYRVQDIDTMEDWEQAELMFRILIQQ